ncbi:MAG: hypothetical protein U0U33_17150 [Chitinophagaceae bacterium]
MEKTKIFVQDGNRYAYTTAFINAENPLGFVKATLKEYTLYKIAETELLIGKLYKTKEGNWYDMPGNTSINPLLRTMIKMAIEESEKANTIIDSHLQ